MGNISIRLNVKQLSHVEREMTGKDGKKISVLIIPIEENKLYVGEKGVYLDITAIEIKNKTGDSKDTHLLKQSFTKDVYDAMNEAEKLAKPILGNAIQWGRQEPAPVISSDLNEMPIESDCLPF